MQLIKCFLKIESQINVYYYDSSSSSSTSNGGGGGGGDSIISTSSHGSGVSSNTKHFWTVKTHLMQILKPLFSWFSFARLQFILVENK